MERETGVEPATSGLGSPRSTPELLPLTGRNSRATPNTFYKLIFLSLTVKL